MLPRSHGEEEKVSCGGCRYLGRNCGGVEGDPGTHTVDPLSLSSRQLLELACTVARISTVICDVAGVQGAAIAASDISDKPYIWDIEED